MLLQQLNEQADAMKKIGVARQCNIHNPLAIAPIASDFNSSESIENLFIDKFIILIISGDATKFKSPIK